MVEQYWQLFYLSLIGALLFAIVLLLGFVFTKRFFFKKKHGWLLLTVFSVILLFFVSLTTWNFVLCCKDYNYVINGTYIEAEAEVIEFTSIIKDTDGNGSVEYRKPKFYISETNEYLVLYTKNVEVGKTYIIRYYPNTRICEVIN